VLSLKIRLGAKPPGKSACFVDYGQECYKTGFAVLHEGALANWLLFQWWTHGDVWCQWLSYSDSSDPLSFRFSTRPVRACVYETAVIWHEQKSWIEHVLNGSPDRRAYLEDMMTAHSC